MILVILTKGQVLNNSYFAGFCAFNFFLNQNEELKSNNFKSFFYKKSIFGKSNCLEKEKKRQIYLFMVCQII